MELSDTESSSDEGPQPQQSQRRQRHNAKKRNRAKQNLDKFDLKPQYKIGDDISGPYWDPDTDPKRKCPTWYGGKIANVTVVNTSSPYGPICKYDIKFDDGDFVADVPEEMIFTQSDYELSHDYTDNKFKLIRDVTDKHTKDNWAKMVGYYVLTLNKEEHKFTFLTDAVAKHDKSVVERKGEKTNKADLYQPKNLKALLKEYRAAQSEKMRYVDCFRIANAHSLPQPDLRVNQAKAANLSANAQRKAGSARPTSRLSTSVFTATKETPARNGSHR